MKIIVVILVLTLSGCARLGATAYADLSDSVGGKVYHNIEGYGRPHGAQGRIGIEGDVRIVGELRLAAGIEHTSFPETSTDRGEERVYVGARYRWEGK